MKIYQLLTIAAIAVASIGENVRACCDITIRIPGTRIPSIKDAHEETRQDLEKLDRKIKEDLKEAERQTKENFKEAERKAKELASSISNGIADMGRDLGKFAREFPKTIESGAQQLGKDIEKLGQNVGKGVGELSGEGHRRDKMRADQQKQLAEHELQAAQREKALELKNTQKEIAQIKVLIAAYEAKLKGQKELSNLLNQNYIALRTLAEQAVSNRKAYKNQIALALMQNKSLKSWVANNKSSGELNSMIDAHVLQIQQLSKLSGEADIEPAVRDAIQSAAEMKVALIEMIDATKNEIAAEKSNLKQAEEKATALR